MQIFLALFICWFISYHNIIGLLDRYKTKPTIFGSILCMEEQRAQWYICDLIENIKTYTRRVVFAFNYLCRCLHMNNVKATFQYV